ncbi:MAG: DUF2231 domain-containing protein [Candidatus Omnitrophica bacterium]|nr:DUF2231 domain-containing protein [Candidatus Omnitrophota bacterium]
MINHWHLHPMIVHFPIALFIGAMGLELFAVVLKKEKLHSAAWINFILAVLGSVIAVITGWFEAEHLHLVSHPVFNTHRLFGFLTVGLGVAALALLGPLKKRSNRWFRFLFLLILIWGVSLVSIGAYYGGRLVYEYGIGVEGD